MQNVWIINITLLLSDCAVNQHAGLLLQIAQVLTAFTDFIEEFGGWAKELIKLLDEYGVCICNVFFCTCIFDRERKHSLS